MPPSAHAQLAVGNLSVMEGFKAELLHTVPKEQQGSWVSMTVDPKGRLIVSDQYGSLYRVTPPEIGGDPEDTQIEKLEVDIGNAQGLLYAFDSLYVMVATDAFQGRGLYRVRDTDGNDQFDEVKQLRSLTGGGEHGPHAILKHPDGESLTIIIGNQTQMTEMDGSKVPTHWGEDLLLPRLWDGNGFMKGVLGPGGWIAKTDPNGEEWELFAVGFRNEYDAAYNHHGELFTFDADMEWDINTPWYRPTRVNHVVSGAEFGWRSGAGKWPAYYADSLAAVVDIGPGSPTGVTFGYGSKFPSKYQQAFYICDWSYGKLYAVHMEESGATYSAEFEEFVTGQPLALTDIEVNPKDGALYFAVGGRRTQSALYRVVYVGNESTAPADLDDRPARRIRQRHELEAYHGRQDPEAVSTAWRQLNSEDRNIRYAARVAIEWQPVDQWKERALKERNADRAIQGIIALARSTGRDLPHRKDGQPEPDAELRAAMLETLDRLRWNRLDDRQKLDLLRAYTLVFTRHGDPNESQRQELIGKFDPHFPTANSDLNAELGQMLVFLEAPTAATKLMAELETAPSQEEQLDIVRMLRTLKTGWTMPLRRDYFNWFVKAGAYKGGASLAGFLRDIKADAVAGLSEPEKNQLQAILDAKPEIKSPMELLATRSFVKEWTVDELSSVSNEPLRNRDFERGRKLYGAVACSACHRFKGEGGAIGPDLTGIAGRFTKKDLLESIIEPSKEISDQYGAIVIVLKNGDFLSGRVANMSGERLSVAENMLAPGDFTNVNREDIESIQPSETSPMPEGLLSTLTEDEIKDLVAYIMSQGDRTDRMFR